MRFLVAEADAMERKFLGKLLSLYGDCQAVADGVAVLDAYLAGIKDNTPYDVIFLDTRLSKLDGFKVLKVLRYLEMQGKTSPEKRLKIFLMGATEPEIPACGFRGNNHDAWIAKPVRVERLMTILKQFRLC